MPDDQEQRVPGLYESLGAAYGLRGVEVDRLKRESRRGWITAHIGWLLFAITLGMWIVTGVSQ